MTSCCPGWVSFMEKHFPELADNLSTAKSPQQMFGAIAKNYFAQKAGHRPQRPRRGLRHALRGQEGRSGAAGVQP